MKKDKIFTKTDKTIIKNSRKEKKRNEIIELFTELTKEGRTTDYSLNEISNKFHIAPQTILNNYIKVRKIKQDIIKNS